MKDRNVSLIIGTNPLCRCITEALKKRGDSLTMIPHFSEKDIQYLNGCTTLVILTSETEDAIAEDNVAIYMLTMLAKLYTNTEGIRPVVHLLLQSQTSLWMLQTMDLPVEVNDKFEVYPFTIEDVWAKNVLVQLPGIKKSDYPALDRISIGKDSKSFVHIVISGFDSQAESIAIHSALIAHYPNYNPEEKIPIRTRITIIDNDILSNRDAFVAKYQHLFNNSYYRTVKMGKHEIDFHHPMYEGKRCDFIDVEWEFVDASISNPVVWRKLETWAIDDRQQLSIFVCHDDEEENLTECMALPKIIYERNIPVMVQQRHKELSEAFGRSTSFKNIRPFGMKDCGYDVSLPLVRLAKLLKYFYDCSYGNVGVPTELPLAEVEKAWQSEKSFKMRFSNMYNVMTISTKMRSLGHDAEDADTFYALTQEEIESLAETEHNRWSVERLIQGARPCTDEETAEIRKDVKTMKKTFKKRDIHFDLRAYNELEDDGTGKNAKVYDYDLTACIPLIVKTFYEENKHGE